MAKVSQGSFTTNEFEGRSLTFNWSVDSTNIAENYKEIYWSLVGSGSWNGFVTGKNFEVIINGEYVLDKRTKIEVWQGTVVASGYHTEYGDDNGNISISASVYANIYYDDKTTVSGSDSWELPTIGRYATINQSLKSKTETSITMTWGADTGCDALQYSIDGGKSFKTVTGYPNYTITGLTANTKYSVITKARRTDSQLWSTSSALEVTTYNYPHCTSSPDFAIGDALTLDFYNPLGRSITVSGYAKTDGRTIFTGTTVGTRLVGFNDSNSVTQQYHSIPNTQSGNYKVVVYYENSAMTRDAGNSYRIRGNETPTINGFDYIDSNETTVAITGNNQHIVQNFSTLSARFNPATANYGAGSIAKYKVVCNGKSAEGSKEGTYSLGAIDSARDVDLTLTVTDSRGLSASKTIKVTMLAHSNPTAIIELQRLNNYEDTTYLTVDASISSVNGKNTSTIQYRYKEKNGNYGSFTEIRDREKQTIEVDKNKEFIFEVVVTDAFGSQFSKEYPLGKGVFPLFIDTGKNSVGINKFPLYENSIEASGTISVGERIVFELEAGKSREIPVFLHGITGLVNFRIAGANLEVAKLYYVFRSNQYFGVHTTLVDASYNNTSSSVPFEISNTEQGYIFKITNNHSSSVYVRYGVIELC